MGRYDWMSVGLKLLGVYFGVSGVASLWGVLLVLIAAFGQGAREGAAVFGILQPAVHLAAAFLLVCRTPTCLRWCGERNPKRPPEQVPLDKRDGKTPNEMSPP
jgi:hypothetical protein